MSELSKLLETRSPAANPANLANPTPEISRISNFSRGVMPNTHLAHDDNLQVLAAPSVQSVDARTPDPPRLTSRGVLRM